jgi:cysteine desulfurase
MDNLIYLDNAATTRVKPEVTEAMRPYFEALYGNPASAYTFAGRISEAVEVARETVAGFIGARPDEIYFTAGGSESDNWALKGLAFSLREKGRHIITSRIEHHAVLHSCAYLEKLGYEITYLDVDRKGFVDLQKLEAAIRPDTILISVMFANNEIGTIEPVREIGRIAHAHGVLFHTDAVQAYGHVPIDVNALNIDLMSVSGHKINAPKGVGFLYIRSGVRIESFLHGGAQERGKRAGTTNVPGIIGLARATELAAGTLAARAAYETALRDRLIARIEQEIPYAILNGDRAERLPNNVNFCFRFIEGESLLLLLDQSGICASSGSACTSGSLDPSHVLLAIGLPHEIAHGSLRLTLSEETTREEVDFTVDTLKEIVGRLRSMAPLYEDFVKKQEAVS